MKMKIQKFYKIIRYHLRTYNLVQVGKETIIPEGNMDPVKEQNWTINFRAETAIGQSSQ